MSEIPKELLKDEPLNLKTPANSAAQPPKSNHKALIWLTVFFLAAGLAWLLLYLLYFQFHESTDDAYVNGNMINVTSVISGTPIGFYADNTDLVEEGQLLVALDPTAYQIEFDKQLASLASTVLQVRQIYDSVNVNQALVKNKQIIFDKARYDYDNRSQLVNSKAVSQEDFTHAKDTMDAAELDLKQAQFQYQVSVDAAGNTPIEKHPLIEMQKAATREAFYNLYHTNIYAPYTGYIAQRNVEVGQWISPNSATMAIIPIDYMWVDANFKETQLTYMRVGQPAKVSFDMYGSSVEFEGKVLGIALGSGSVFSLIPPQNATGNWIKIVQRLPVRIGVDLKQMKDYPLRLGISAEVNVDITNTSLPMLPLTPSTKPVSKTKVFEIDLADVDKKMDKIVQENLATPQ